MIMIIKRNFLLYFRNRSGVVLSLLGAMISFILYLVFLKANIKTSWSQVPHTNQLLDSWLIGGTLAITGLTTTFSSFSQLAKDRESNVTQDLVLTDLGRWGLSISYLLSTAIIGFLMQIIMFTVMEGYFIWDDQIVVDWTLLPQILLIMVLNALLCSIFNGILVNHFKSVDTLGKLATIIGAASGFLVGTYIPIGVLPSFAQTIMKCTPSTYIASLFRQVMMKDSLATAFHDNTAVQDYFEKMMGIQLKWESLLTMKETYYIVVVVLVALLVIWTIQQFATNRWTKTA